MQFHEEQQRRTIQELMSGTCSSSLPSHADVLWPLAGAFSILFWRLKNGLHGQTHPNVQLERKEVEGSARNGGKAHLYFVLECAPWMHEVYTMRSFACAGEEGNNN